MPELFLSILKFQMPLKFFTSLTRFSIGYNMLFPPGLRIGFTAILSNGYREKQFNIRISRAVSNL
jgi:hypothetical protein